VHNNFYFLRRLTKSLEARLSKAVISECFSQSRDELVVRFETHHQPFVIKASLVPAFSCLSFPIQYHRARKNSVDLFQVVIGRRVQEIRQFQNERSFAILLSDGIKLLFKMHGNRSNVILLENERVIDLFKKNLTADQLIKPAELDREIDWSFETFKNFHDKPSALYFTFGKLVWEYAEAHGYHHQSIAEKWALIQQMRVTLEEGEIRIIRHSQTPALSLLPMGHTLKIFSDPIEAINEFYYQYTEVFAFQQEKTLLISQVESVIRSGRSYHEKALQKLRELQEQNNYRIWGDLIMANLQKISPGSDKVQLENFYEEHSPIEIKLKKDLSPQKNAEVYYRKAKNQKIEAEHLLRAAELKEKEIREKQAVLEQIAQTADLRSLRNLSAHLAGREETKKGPPAPYHEFEHMGFRIWVGKNAESNDVLTLKYSYKEDLWLHAKDVAGSHVLIKHQAGKNFPKDVITRAAQLAAYNSKRKNETLCPVIVTPKKFVRKRKGDPPGMVVVEREEVIMVEPRL